MSDRQSDIEVAHLFSIVRKPGWLHIAEASELDSTLETHCIIAPSRYFYDFDFHELQ